MRVNAILLIATLAVLILSGVMAGQAEAACNVRISHTTNNDCLSARFSWSAWGAPTIRARNMCHEHGTVVARVDAAAISDTTWTLDHGNWRQVSHGSGTKIRGVYCCWDDSNTDLCHQAELEPNEWNWLKFKSGNEFGTQKLDTSKKKCAFCERYSGSIWCENSFDDSICESGEDGDLGGVSLANCQVAWDASSAAGSCTITGRSSNASGCIYLANCQGSSGTEASGTVSIVDAYHLHNCSGDLRVGECPR